MYRIISPNRQDYFAKKGGFAMALPACNTETDSAGRELTVHGTAAFPIACYHDDLEAAPVPWHWHEELELLIASEGGVLAAAAGEKYTLAEGDGLFINAGVLHADWPLAVGAAGCTAWYSIPGWWAAAGQRVLAKISAAAADPTPAPPPAPCCAAAWIGSGKTMGCMERAFRAVVNEIPGYEFKTRAALSEMMYLLVTRAPATRAVPKKALRSADRH